MTATPAIAAALCMPATNTPFHLAKECELLSIPVGFFDGPTMLRGRKEAECCEKDPTWKQLLPYAVAMDKAGLIYCYTRGAAGAEGRLHGNISIGLGGHVDVAPQPGESLRDVLALECNRELEEEAGLPTAPVEFLGLICDPTNDVGMVHIGLLNVRRITEAEKTLMLGEPGVVEKGEFVSLDYLQSADAFPRLENWSKLAVQFLARERAAGRFAAKQA
jgi:predicted NUDIX family phosphoesterase